MPDLDRPDVAGTQMQPKFFLTGATLPEGSYDSDRRSQLAEWLTENQWFAIAAVNRLWSELIGEGFVEPIDDLGPEREPHAPRTFDFVSAEFAHHGYDVKWLFRTIMSTEAYQRESRPRRPRARGPGCDGSRRENATGAELRYSCSGVISPGTVVRFRHPRGVTSRSAEELSRGAARRMEGHRASQAHRTEDVHRERSGLDCASTLETAAKRKLLASWRWKLRPVDRSYQLDSGSSA